MTNKDKTSSEIITDFLNLIHESSKKYEIAAEKIGNADKATIDLLHSIEFTTSYGERNKLATTLHAVRNDRRYYKDIKEEAEVIVEYFQGNKKAINQLKEMLGQLRKVEKYHENRSYIPRYIK